MQIIKSKLAILLCLSTLTNSEMIRDNKKEVVLDTETNLMWQDNIDAKTIKKPWITKKAYDAENYFDTSGDTAASYCENLKFAGFNDWRLPSRMELLGLGIAETNKNGLTIKSGFQNVNSSHYWSSTTLANSEHSQSNHNAWFAGYSFWGTHWMDKKVEYAIRCVRDSE